MYNIWKFTMKTKNRNWIYRQEHLWCHSIRCEFITVHAVIPGGSYGWCPLRRIDRRCGDQYLKSTSIHKNASMSIFHSATGILGSPDKTVAYYIYTLDRENPFRNSFISAWDNCLIVSLPYPARPLLPCLCSAITRPIFQQASNCSLLTRVAIFS